MLAYIFTSVNMVLTKINKGGKRMGKQKQLTEGGSNLASHGGSDGHAMTRSCFACHCRHYSGFYLFIPANVRYHHRV